MPFSFRAAGLSLLAFACVARAAGPAAPYQHVLVLQIDGLHAADLTDPATASYLPDVLDLAAHGVTYSNAYAVKPTDNFPNAIAQFTGATPKTSGIYYDLTYRRDYFSPGATDTTFPGASADWTGNLDKDNTLLSGGGNADASAIEPANLPKRVLNGALSRVYPHDDLKVNTAFEVAHAAGLRTAFIEKHPSYEILNGPSGAGLDDFYAPESDAKARLLNGVLVDSTAGAVKSLAKISSDITLSQAYDDLRLGALLNQIDGKTSRGAAAPGAPALFGMSFIAVNTAQKDENAGGLDDFGGGTIVNPGLASALAHTNASVRTVVDALKAANLYDSTLVVLTSKHGQSPRVGAASVQPGELIISTLGPAGIPLRQTTDDDVSLVWLDKASDAAAAKAALLDRHGDVISQILTGQALVDAGLNDPATDPRAPDLLVLYKSGILIADSLKRAEHGGFSEDDSHIAMILGGGGIPAALQGTTRNDNVLDTQLAPTMLEALGLDPSLLQGVVIDGTTDLPGSGIAVPEPAGLAALAGPWLLTLRRRRRDAR